MRGQAHIPIILCVLACSTTQVFGLTRTWDGGAATENWADAANWNPDGVPTPDVDDVFIADATVDLQGAIIELSGRTVLVTNSTLKSNGSNNSLMQDTVGIASSFVASNCTFPSTLNIRSPQDMLLVNCDYDAKAKDGVLRMTTPDQTLTIIGGHFIATSAQILMNSHAGVNSVLVVGGTGTHNCTALNSGVAQAGANTLTFSNCTFFCTGGNTTTWQQNGIGSSVAVSMVNATNRFSASLTIGSNVTISATNSAFEWDQRSGSGSWDNTMTNEVTFDGEGMTWIFYGETKTTDVEICGTDLGADFAGFHDNFSIDKLHLRALSLDNPLAHTNGLELVDDHDNDLAGGAEALYTDVLSLDRVFTTTCSVSYNGLNLYYKKLINTNSYSFTEVGGSATQVTGAVLTVASFTHAPENVKRFDKDDAPLTVNSDYGTLFVGGFANGKAVNVLLDVSGTGADIEAIRDEIGGSDGFGQYEIQILYSGVANGSDLFFDFNFSHRNVTLNQFSTGSQPGTIFTVN